MLFTADFPGKKTGNFLDDINPDSKRVYVNSKVNRNMLTDMKVGKSH